MCPTQRDDPRSVLGRVGVLLDAFDQQNSRLSVSQLARRTGLPKSTVHRLTIELRTLGWLELHDRRVQLGMRLFEYGLQVPRRQSLREAALPFMEDLREATGFRVHLAVLEHIEVVYLEILQAKTGPTMASRTGGRLPAHATGVGKAMLAFAPGEVVQARVEAGLPRLTPYTICTPGGLIRHLTKIRKDGVAFDREENRLGVSCAAAPIVGAEGACLGALSVSGATSARSRAGGARGADGGARPQPLAATPGDELLSRDNTVPRGGRQHPVPASRPGHRSATVLAWNCSSRRSCSPPASWPPPR